MSTTLVFNPLTGSFDAVLLATANVQAWMATPSSANLLAALSDKTGTGLNVFATAPALTGPVTLAEAVGSSALVITGATQTASFPALSVTQTWNNSGVTFTALKLNVTNTASAAASLLLDLQVGGASLFNVTRGGFLQVGPTAATGAAPSTPQIVFGTTTGGWLMSDPSNFGVAAGAGTAGATSWLAGQTTVGGIRVRSGDAFTWGSSATTAVAGINAALYSDAANVLAQRNSTNAQTFRLYNTYTDASNYERLSIAFSSGIAAFVREHAGTGSANFISFLLPNTTTSALKITNQGSYGAASSVAALQLAPSWSSSSAQTALGITMVDGTGAGNANTSGTVTGVQVKPLLNPSSTSTMVGEVFKINPTINFSAGTPGAGSYEALKIAVTETALPTGTNYLIRASNGAAGTTDVFSVDRTGIVRTTASGSGGYLINVSGQPVVGIGRNGSVGGLDLFGNDLTAACVNISAPTSSGGLRLHGSAPLGFTNGVITQANDVQLWRDAASTLALRSTSTAQTFRIYNTWTDASNGEWATLNWASNVLHIGATKNGTGTARVMQLDYGGTTTAAISIPITSGTVTFGGGLTLADAGDLVVGSSTGTKLATATSQKLGFWNTTPIVQPTTAIAAATFVANTSLIANDTATFDGYTLGQVVKALRNAGLLA